jgi:hypothetical protein
VPTSPKKKAKIPVLVRLRPFTQAAHVQYMKLEGKNIHFVFLLSLPDTSLLQLIAPSWAHPPLGSPNHSVLAHINLSVQTQN